MNTQTTAGPRLVRAPRGTEISCKGWQQEAAMRMLMNNLDPEVAEDPDKLIVYGGAGKAARDWNSFDAIVRTLRRLKDDETLLVQSGKPVGVFETHEMAPRVLIANANLVGDWANWDEFRRLDALGLTMYGQMTAGSWIYIGTQGILQGTYQTFAAAGQKHYGADLAGRLVLTAGLGGMGGAQPLAVTMAGGVALCVEVDPHRIERRLETGYVDVAADSLDEALKLADEAMTARKPLSIALLGNAADVYPELVRRGVMPDLVTDQTSAHDVLNGYVPNGMTLDEALVLRREDPDDYVRRAIASIVVHVEAMVALQNAGAHTFDYGNNIRGVAKEAGYADAFAFPGFVPAYIRPLFCRGNGPFRWAALSGDPQDIAVTDAALLEAFPDNEMVTRWIKMAGEKVQFQGLPCRICWLEYGERAKAGELFNDLVRTGKVKAPHRHRPRPPRLGFGREPVPRDREHDGRQRRDRRLADPQRPAQHRRRRQLGEFPPRRRRGHRQEPARRHGRRRRRHRHDGRAPAPRPHHRPGHRRHAPRRRRLPGGDREGQGSRHRPADGGD